MADDGYDEPTPQEKIAANQREMERIREAHSLQKLGYPVKRNEHQDQERLITLSLENKRLQSEASAAENKWHDDHDL